MSAQIAGSRESNILDALNGFQGGNSELQDIATRLSDIRNRLIGSRPETGEQGPANFPPNSGIIVGDFMQRAFEYGQLREKIRFSLVEIETALAMTSTDKPSGLAPAKTLR